MSLDILPEEIVLQLHGVDESLWMTPSEHAIFLQMSLKRYL